MYIARTRMDMNTEGKMDLYVDFIAEWNAWFVMDMDQPGAVEAGPFKTETEASRWLQRALLDVSHRQAHLGNC
jgi:hypothetical protein